MSLATFSMTLPYVFIHSCQPELRNLDFFTPCRSLHRKCFDSRSWTRKSDIIRPRYELFNACGDLCSSLPSFYHYLTFSFIPLSPCFEIWIFSSHVAAYTLSFDSRSWTRKSDIIRPRYEVFNAWGDWCPSLPSFWHYLTFSFTSLNLSFGI